VKEKFMKGSVIAKIPSCERKIHERLHDSRKFHYKKGQIAKGLHDSRWLRESLNPTVKGIPTERSETTTCCGLNPTVKGIPTERPETTTSCGLNPIVEGIPIKRPETTSCGPIPITKGWFIKSSEIIKDCD
jgi:hypothetical protein